MNPVDQAASGAAEPAAGRLETQRVEASIAEPALRELLSVGSASFEALRLLRAKIATVARQRPFDIFGLVGVAPGEGASTSAIGLACALARDAQHRVLLLEADLHHPTASLRLGLPAATGLAEHLGPEALPPTLQRVDPLGFTLLPAGEPSAEAAERLGSPAFTRLLGELRKAFDVIVVDCPPITPAADAIVLQDRLDGMLLVVRSRKTPAALIRRAVSHLKPERVAGVVFNDHRDLLDGLPRRWRKRLRS